MGVQEGLECRPHGVSAQFGGCNVLINRSALIVLAVLGAIAWTARPATAQIVLFVDSAATGANDGSSWEDAFTNLQDALAAARALGARADEVRVAQGTYTPAEPNGNRAASFEMIDGVVIRGGYGGVSAANPDRWNPTAFPTILSGDLNGDDDTAGIAENVYHVVTAGPEVTNSARLQGFTITAGNANASIPDNRGAGMYVNGGAPTVVGCIFHANVASSGGGLFNQSGAPRVASSSFVGNEVSSFGGGLYHTGGAAIYDNCTVTENSAGGGGGIYSLDPAVVITNSIFWENSDFGGNSETAQIRFATGSPSMLTDTCIQNCANYCDEPTNIGNNPNFVNAAADNFRLKLPSPCANTGDNLAVPADILTDLDGSVRIGSGTVDMGAYEGADDCNGNGILDSIDLINGNSFDCFPNGLPDECELSINSGCPGARCTENCANDCNANCVPDTCEDCNGNGFADECDIADGTSEDCNDNGIPDECEPDEDCNNNGTQDICDIAAGTSDDCNNDGVPDECRLASDSGCPGANCESDCDPDCNGNCRLDECDIAEQGDCNANGVPDDCDIDQGDSDDCTDVDTGTGNNIPDECQISADSTAPGGPFFCTQNCDPDCNDNAIPDACEIDCNDNDVPDDCDVRDGFSEDCDSNGVPDECQEDSDGDGVINACDACPDTPPDTPVRDNGCQQQGACCLPTGSCLDNQLAGNCLSFPNARFLGDLLTCDGDPDGDLAIGCDDGCPLDPEKTEPGLCGCGLSDDGDIPAGSDCNGNGVEDRCEINAGLDEDCNANLVLDSCDLQALNSEDCNANSVPDECEISVDSNAPGGPFFCFADCDPDCNVNGTPDECDIAVAVSEDCDENGVPDECQPDSDQDGIPDACDPCLGENDLEGLACDNPADPDPCRSGVYDCSTGVLVCTDDEFADDEDGDGVFDCFDDCPGTAPGSEIDENGCPPEGTCCFIGAGGNPGFFCDVTRDFCINDLGGVWQGNGSPCPTSAAECIFPADGDCDFDTDFDFDDFVLVNDCIERFYAQEPDESCRCADLSGDGVLDLLDVGSVQVAWELERLCPVGATGDCCDLAGLLEAGCGDRVCCETVCEIVPSCCTTQWTADCAAIAQDLEICNCVPGACCVTESPFCVDLPAGECRGVGGFPLEPGTDCLNDGGVCVGECPPDAVGDCCDRAGLADGGCGDPFCCEAVCNLEPSCCYDTWTSECTQLALTTVADECGCPTVACCTEVGGLPACLDLTPELCNARGGFSLGTGTVCSIEGGVCSGACPDGATGDCCDRAGLPDAGCGDDLCCQAVCAEDPSCCYDQWEASCALIALTTADPECGCPTEACCFVDTLTCDDLTPERCAAQGGFALGSGTDCATNGLTCQQPCPPNATGDCCDPAGQIEPGCGERACCNAVCLLDPSCCLSDWGPRCAFLAQQFPDECTTCPTVACCADDNSCRDTTARRCSLDGDFPQEEGTSCAAGDCAIACPSDPTAQCCNTVTPSPNPGCTDRDCCNAVCNIKRSCCEVAWTVECSRIAAEEVPSDCRDLIPPNPDDPTPLCEIRACCVVDDPDDLDGDRCIETSAAVCQWRGGVVPPRADPSDPLPTCADNNANDIADVCEAGCPPNATGNCCNPAGIPAAGCGDTDCCDAVCAIDSSCCTIEWTPDCAVIAATLPAECACPASACCFADGSCQDLPAAICVDDLGEPREGITCAGDKDDDGVDDACGVCGPGAGDCCSGGASNFTPGCENIECCTAVCEFEPLCCTDAWDLNLCDFYANDLCAICQP